MPEKRDQGLTDSDRAATEYLCYSSPYSGLYSLEDIVCNSAH